MAQLVEQSLLTPENHGSNLVMSKLDCFVNCIELYGKEMKKKDTGNVTIIIVMKSRAHLNKTYLWPIL